MTQVFVAGSRAWSPVQKTTLRFVGSTTGRQIAGRSIRVAAPVAGSIRNEATGENGPARPSSSTARARK